MSEQSEEMGDSSEEYWEDKLSSEEYRILRERGTEPKFSGEYLEVWDDGTYHCAGCGASLFPSDAKFESDHGWPSFYDAKEENIEYQRDTRHGMDRTEVVCANCGGHLGHVFEDGPNPTGKRFCINSAALSFEEEDGTAQSDGE